VTRTRRHPSRRITPERMAFYKKRAHRLREEAWRDMWTGLWAAVKSILRRR
jgi:hypothetical protein